MSFMPGATPQVREISDEQFAREAAERARLEEAGVQPADAERLVEERPDHDGHTQVIGAVTVGEATQTADLPIFDPPLPPASQALADDLTRQGYGLPGESVTMSPHQQRPEPLAVDIPNSPVIVATAKFVVSAGDAIVFVEAVDAGWKVYPKGSEREITFPDHAEGTAMDSARTWAQQLDQVQRQHASADRLEWDAFQAIVDRHRQVIEG